MKRIYILFSGLFLAITAVAAQPNKLIVVIRSAQEISADVQRVDSEERKSDDGSWVQAQSRKNSGDADARALSSLPGYIVSLAHQLSEVPNKQEGEQVSESPNNHGAFTAEDIRSLKQKVLNLAYERNPMGFEDDPCVKEWRRARLIQQCKQSCKESCEIVGLCCLAAGFLGAAIYGLSHAFTT